MMTTQATAEPERALCFLGLLALLRLAVARKERRYTERWPTSTPGPRARARTEVEGYQHGRFGASSAGVVTSYKPSNSRYESIEKSPGVESRGYRTIGLGYGHGYGLG